MGVFNRLSFLAIACSVLLAGCNGLSPTDGSSGSAPDSDDAADTAPVSLDFSALPGTALASWGDFAYAIGGRDSDGNLRKEVWVARVGEDGSLDAWSRTADLPEGRAFASAVVVGPYVYAIGGETAAGEACDVLFALVDTNDASSGYGGLYGFSSGWQKNPTKLPAGLTKSSALVADGRILTAGGISGQTATSALYTARVRADGIVGQWQSMPNSLPDARYGTAVAIDDGSAVMVGGYTGTALPKNYLTAEWTAAGSGAWTAGTGPSAASAFSALLPVANGLLLYGGIDASGPRSTAELFTSSYWLSATYSGYPAYAPSCATVGPAAVRVTAIHGASAPTGASGVPANPRCAEPDVFPPSGWVRSGTAVTAVAPTGTVIRYTSGTIASPPGAVETGSAVWDEASGATITADAILRFRAYRSGYAASAEVTRTFRIRAGGTLSMLQATVAPGESGTHALTEKHSDGSELPVNLVWLRISIPERGIWKIGVTDKSVDAANCSATVDFSLFEQDFFLSVFDRSGKEIAKRAGGSDTTVELAAGYYYLLVEANPSDAGGTFGVSLARN
jgi:hypothetical protein